MGIRSAFLRLLARGTADDRDGDEHVELCEVSQFEGPLLVVRLRSLGIEAVATETFAASETWTRYRITVPRRDLHRAAALWRSAPTEE